MSTDIYELKHLLDSKKIFFSFCGPISQDLMVEIGDVIKRNMARMEGKRPELSKVFAILVEQVQNIIHYSDEKYPIDDYDDAYMSVGIVAVGVEGEFSAVMCGNKISNKKVKHLRDKLRRLQKMSKEELKAYYKDQRRKDPHKGSLGAGLGFIEMARRASRPLQFNFKKLDADYSFFTVKTLV